MVNFLAEMVVPPELTHLDHPPMLKVCLLQGGTAPQDSVHRDE